MSAPKIIHEFGRKDSHIQNETCVDTYAQTGVENTYLFVAAFFDLTSELCCSAPAIPAIDQERHGPDQALPDGKIR